MIRLDYVGLKIMYYLKILIYLYYLQFCLYKKKCYILCFSGKIFVIFTNNISPLFGSFTNLIPLRVTSETVPITELPCLLLKLRSIKGKLKTCNEERI